MRNAATVVLSALLLLTSLQVLAHAGEVHTYMGTVARVESSGVFMLKKTDGVEIPVEVSAKTAYLDSKGRPTTATKLAVGMRVVVKISKDGKTALSVKMSLPKSTG